MDQQQNQMEQGPPLDPQVAQVGGDPRVDNVAVARGTDQQMRNGQHMVKLCPKYDRKIPWPQFVYEFKSWVETFEIYHCGDAFIKNTLVWAMRGQAQDMINLHRQGTPTFINHVTWRDYAVAIESIFAPRAESQLAKQEFKAYRQRQTEDISSYLSTKRALHEVAYPRGEGNFDNLLEEVIKGIYNREVKLQLLRSNPQNPEQMEINAVQIVANERAAYESGYSRSETKDGLYHTTMMGRREMQEDPTPMDVNALKEEIRTLQESINTVKPMDKSKITCYHCNKKGHMKSECRSLAAQRGGFRGRGGYSGRNTNQRGGHSGGKFPFDCHHCGKAGHKKSECYKWKQEQQKGGQRGQHGQQRGGQFGQRRVRDMDNQDQSEESASGYSRFLGGTGETEEN